MTNGPITWFVVADGAKARILQRAGHGDQPIAEQACWVAPEASQRSRDLVSDRPGRSFESATTGRHAVEPKSDPHDAAEEAFERWLATQIDGAVSRHEVDALFIVAPPRTMGVLRRSLAPATRERIVREETKDLVPLPTPELIERLRALAQEAGSGPA